jgi:chromosomal replication initiator protein
MRDFMNKMQEIWDKTLISMQNSINKQSFDMWFKDTVPLSISGNILRIKVIDEVAQRHISENYSSAISTILTGITGNTTTCEFTSEAMKEQVKEPIEYKHDNNYSMLYPNYTFENFVVGPNNQLTHAAAISVSNAPASQYNPLFIYGGSGLGKTHLMQAIGHKIIKEKPYLSVLYITSEQYLNEFLYSIRTNTQPSFKIKYRNVDILLIDDIHFLATKEQTQEEFFHTFNALHNNKKQIVITSDRPPKELSTLEERLKTRFEWGLITDIQAPNIETREAILRNKAEREGIDIPDDVLNFIARRIKSNIRALESALTRLNAVSKTYNEPINIQSAKIHLKDLFNEDSNKKITIVDVMNKVGEKFQITIEDIVSKSRHSKVVLPRFVAMYITRKLTDMTTVDIGKEFGDRDHSTVLNAMSNVERMMSENEEIKEQINEIISELKS